jgi:hypothetical protein
MQYSDKKNARDDPNILFTICNAGSHCFLLLSALFKFCEGTFRYSCITCYKTKHLAAAGKEKFLKNYRTSIPRYIQNGLTPPGIR